MRTDVECISKLANATNSRATPSEMAKDFALTIAIKRQLSFPLHNVLLLAPPLPYFAFPFSLSVHDMMTQQLRYRRPIVFRLFIKIRSSRHKLLARKVRIGSRIGTCQPARVIRNTVSGVNGGLSIASPAISRSNAFLISQSL